jgi:16S rRNA (guanine527-N7)-methyltransferase
VDLGSGGGFPGIVCAIVAQGAGAGPAFDLVESDQRKCAFLRTAVRELGLRATVHAARAESLPPLSGDVISARALAPLGTLFDMAFRHLAPGGGTLLLPKGAGHADEIEVARERWRFTVEALPSITNPEARILRCRLAGRIRDGRVPA